jgi:hypothetical protein
MTKANKAKSVSAVCALVCIAASPVRSQTTFSVQGRTYDSDTGASIRGVTIIAVRGPQPGSRNPMLFQAKSQVDGSFTLQAPGGRYALCVEAGNLYLDPCAWFPSTTTINVPQAAAVNLPLKRGVLTVVRVSDPNGIVAAVRGAQPVAATMFGAPIAITVSNRNGSLWSLLADNSTGPVWSFSLLVPSSTTLTLTVVSPLLQLADEEGMSLSQAGFQTEFTSPDVSAAPATQPSFFYHLAPRVIPAKEFTFRALSLF